MGHWTEGSKGWLRCSDCSLLLRSRPVSVMLQLCSRFSSDTSPQDWAPVLYLLIIQAWPVKRYLLNICSLWLQMSAGISDLAAKQAGEIRPLISESPGFYPQLHSEISFPDHSGNNRVSSKDWPIWFGPWWSATGFLEQAEAREELA